MKQSSPELLLPLGLHRKTRHVCFAAQGGSFQQWVNPAQRIRALGFTYPRWRLTTGAADEVVRDADSELQGFWGREMVTLHGKMEDIIQQNWGN